MEKTDCAVIGAGVVGLAVARTLALSGRDVVILESAEAPGLEASSRTGEVIHAGLHYRAGSLRARLCVQGIKLLYDYCRERGISCQRTGELVVSAEKSQDSELKKLLEQATENGVDEIELLDGKEVESLEPGLTCTGALLSPATGIVDSHGLMKALSGDAESAGAVLVFNTPFTAGSITSAGFEIGYVGPEPGKLTCRSLVNCAGIHAQQVAASLEGLDPIRIPPAYLCKGSYFTTNMKVPVSRLVYSLPVNTVPGIHLSFDLAGQARFGPDSQWVERIDYEVNPAKSELFTRGVKRYWPELPDGALQPGFAGYFARTYGPEDNVRDWMIQGPEEHGIPGLVNLFGIDSPGLTACIAIGEMVRGMII